MIVAIVLLLSIICVTIGVTYAAFTFTKEGSVENTLETSTIMLTYTEGKTGILLNEAYPMSDEKGKILTGENNVFDFTVQANLSRTMSIGYEVTAVKIPITDMTPLLDNEVKLYLERAIDPDTNYSEVLSPSNFISRGTQTEIGSPIGSMILDSGNFTQAGTTIHNYRLRMWVDENVNISNGESRKYGIKINVYAKQDITVSPVESVNSKYFTFDVETGTITGYSDDGPKNLVIPSTIKGVEVKAIGESAFANKELNSVTFPESLTTIDVSSFQSNNLTTINIPKNVTYIGENAFLDNPLTNINDETGNDFNWVNITGKDDITIKVPLKEPNNKNIIAIYQYNQNKNSSHFCVTGEESTCEQIGAQETYAIGTIIKYKVNDVEEKYFHVLADNGNTITLQQRENIVFLTQWNDSIDSNKKGPVTILPALENATKGWSNVLNQTYTLGSTVFQNNAYTGCSNYNSCTTNTYTLPSRTAKARLITLQEVSNLGCTLTTRSCPIWMYNYLNGANSNGGTNSATDNGYWTSSTPLDVSVNSWFVHYTGRLYTIDPTHTYLGARAVVQINK